MTSYEYSTIVKLLTGSPKPTKIEHVLSAFSILFNAAGTSASNYQNEPTKQQLGPIRVDLNEPEGCPSKGSAKGYQSESFGPCSATKPANDHTHSLTNLNHISNESRENLLADTKRLGGNSSDSA